MSSLDPMIFGYAVEGVRDWKNNADHSTRTDAEFCVGQKHLANVEMEIPDALQQSISSAIPKFIPMPQNEKGDHRKKGFLWPFFALANSKHGSQEITRFELVILYKGKQCLAFRLEPGHPKSPHDYTHLQFSRKPFRKKVPVHGIPSFVSDSYPAFPLPGSDTLSLFLSMVAAVHGHAGTLSMIERVFQAGSDPKQGSQYALHLEKLLRVDGNGG